MTDEILEQTPPAADNIRTLLYQLGAALDERFAHYRHGTIYQSVRPSDVRVFVRATQGQYTISEIARLLSITRQATQSSVQRLQKLQVLDLESRPNNRRDKVVVVTARGQHASKTAKQQIQRFEAEFAAVIGAEQVECLRRDLAALLEATRVKNKADSEKLTPPA